MPTEQSNTASLEPMNVIIGQDFYDGHVDRWRAGVVIPESLDASRGGLSVFVNVRCPPRGRERKERVIQCVLTSLLRDTPTVRAKLLAAGYDPEQPNGVRA